MKKSLILLLLIIFSFSLFDLSSAYTPGSKYNAAWLRYSRQKKNPGGAALGALLLPTVGHAYAGDWPRGFPFLLGELAGAAIIVSSAQTSPVNFVQLGAGVGVALIAKVWEILDAAGTADQYNKKLKYKLGISSYNPAYEEDTY